MLRKDKMHKHRHRKRLKRTIVYDTDSENDEIEVPVYDYDEEEQKTIRKMCEKGKTDTNNAISRRKLALEKIKEKRNNSPVKKNSISSICCKEENGFSENDDESFIIDDNESEEIEYDEEDDDFIVDDESEEIGCDGEDDFFFEKEKEKEKENEHVLCLDEIGSGKKYLSGLKMLGIIEKFNTILYGPNESEEDVILSESKSNTHNDSDVESDFSSSDVGSVYEETETCYKNNDPFNMMEKIMENEYNRMNNVEKNTTKSKDPEMILSVEYLCGDTAFMDILSRNIAYGKTGNKFIDRCVQTNLLKSFSTRQMGSQSRKGFDLLRLDTKRHIDLFKSACEGRLSARKMTCKELAVVYKHREQFIGQCPNRFSDKGAKKIIRENIEIERGFYNIMCDCCQEWYEYIPLEDDYFVPSGKNVSWILEVEKKKGLDDIDYGINAKSRKYYNSPYNILCLQMCEKCAKKILYGIDMVKMIKMWCEDMEPADSLPKWLVSGNIREKRERFFEVMTVVFLTAAKTLAENITRSYEKRIL